MWMHLLNEQLPLLFHPLSSHLDVEIEAPEIVYKHIINDMVDMPMHYVIYLKHLKVLDFSEIVSNNVARRVVDSEDFRYPGRCGKLQ